MISNKNNEKILKNFSQTNIVPSILHRMVYRRIMPPLLIVENLMKQKIASTFFRWRKTFPSLNRAELLAINFDASSFWSLSRTTKIIIYMPVISGWKSKKTRSNNRLECFPALFQHHSEKLWSVEDTDNLLVSGYYFTNLTC